jgi:hypothetical protein
VTEADWLEAKQPGPMVEYLEQHREQFSARKLRLLATAWCRGSAHLLPDEQSRSAIEIVERYAEGKATLWELADVRSIALAAERSTHPQAARAVYWAASRRPDISLSNVWEGAGQAVALDAMGRSHVDVRNLEEVYNHALAMVGREQADLVRECLGNPFRPVNLDPTWLRWSHGIVGQLAQGIYEDRAFDRLPILGDALEEAGCHDRAILDHCRGPGPHVLGCWLIDCIVHNSSNR